MSVRRRAVVLSVALVALVLPGVSFAANPYPPPATGSARVDPSRIRAGECAVFSGDGFAPAASVAIDDNGAPMGSARADGQGRFSQQLCYGSDARRGRHVLSGSGLAPGGQPLTVSATLIVEGVRQNASGPSAVSGGSATGSSGGTSPEAAPGIGITDPGNVSGPGTVVDPGVGPGNTAAPDLDSRDLGLWRLGLGLLGFLLAMVVSWWILLLARRRRRGEDEGEGDLPLSSLTN